MLALLIPGVGMGGGSPPVEPPPVFDGTIPDIARNQNTGTYQFDLDVYFTGASSYSIAPAVEAGWSFNTSTARLTIDTDAVGGFGPYTITATNSGGTDDSNAFDVTVVAVVEGGATGGWLTFINTYESQLQRRREEQRKRKELEEETDQIKDDLDRNIAQLMREQEAIDAKKADLERLGQLAKQNADLEAARKYSERVAKAYARALSQENYKALEALDRELQQAQQEEEFLLLAIMLADE